jgi:RNA recognition motif-containing protein
MPTSLYVANLAPSVTQDQLRELFSRIGQVEDVQHAHFDPTGQIADAALVQMEDDSAALEAQRQLNGYVLEGYHLAVSRADAPSGLRATPDIRQIAGQIAQQLNEDAAAQRRIERVLCYGGIEFAQAIVDEALAIEAQDGMMTVDGSRRRTPGGVFFYLVRGRVSDEVRREIYGFRKKKKAADDQPQTSEQSQPSPEGQPAPAKSGKARSTKGERGKPAPAISNAAPAVTLQATAELTPEIQEKFVHLRQAHLEAQRQLDAIRSNPPNQQAGLFSAMKAVVDLQKQIDTLLREYPQLKEA